jgi:hypothetical protein
VRDRSVFNYGYLRKYFHSVLTPAHTKWWYNETRFLVVFPADRFYIKTENVCAKLDAVVCLPKNVCHGNVTVPSVFIVCDLVVAVNNKRVRCCLGKKKNGWGTKYFVVLLIIIRSITYYDCLYFALVVRNANRIFPASYYVVKCGLSGCTIFFHIIS